MRRAGMKPGCPSTICLWNCSYTSFLPLLRSEIPWQTFNYAAVPVRALESGKGKKGCLPTIKKKQEKLPCNPGIKGKSHKQEKGRQGKLGCFTEQEYDGKRVLISFVTHWSKRNRHTSISFLRELLYFQLIYLNS